MTALNLPLTVDLKHVHLTDEQFYQLCINNPELSIERSAEGILVVMPLVGGDDSNRQVEFGTDLGLWNRQTQLGTVFSSSTVFRLPNGGSRSPDAAWIELSRWRSLTPEQRQKFPPIAPDFVMELRSRTDDLAMLQDKMLEYLDSGVRLGWLFNPQDQQVEIYRIGQDKEIRPLPTQLNGEEVLPGFILSVEVFRE
ncbi:MAG: Uma2 family endonuclease [Leptolyngbya sp. DLM2.Bin15]|nr:MAG: Uma2 family endonuclease [Leptolyngbya sp. DLM2.Bin15]